MSKKILLVDDELDFLKVLKTRLEVDGFDVITATDGEIGLKKCEQEKPDLVIMDITMPNKDGYMLICELKQKEAFKKVPVIVLTAREGMKDLFMWEGAVDYLVKPVDTKELLARIGKLLR